MQSLRTYKCNTGAQWNAAVSHRYSQISVLSRVRRYRKETAGRTRPSDHSVPERVDRVEVGGPHRRIDPEDQAGRHRHEEPITATIAPSAGHLVYNIRH